MLGHFLATAREQLLQPRPELRLGHGHIDDAAHGCTAGSHGTQRSGVPAKISSSSRVVVT